jgi:diguanylate cyclase (GGDEF)-like protein/putative nucleotidyltransferase with HDIG domain
LSKMINWRSHLDPPLSERLRFSAAPSASSISGNRALMARSFAYLFGFGAMLLALTLLLPGATDREVLPLAGIAVAALLVAAICVLGYERLPLKVLKAMPLFGNLLIAACVWFGGANAGLAYTLFFFWVGLAAFYFFDRRYALLCSGVACAAAGLLLILRPGPDLGLLKWVMLTGALLVAGTLVGRLRSRTDSLVEQLADAARTDVLTGLANRREFEAGLAREVSRSSRSGKPLALIVLDLDGLKPINDLNGHHAGDLVLQRVASVLRAHSREGDTLARIGGDEFAAIVPDASQSKAFGLAERLRETVRTAFAADPNRVTLCAGIALYGSHGTKPKDLAEAADQALYSAKRLGGDCSVIYSRQIATSVAELGISPNRELPSSLEAILSLAQLADVRQMGSARHSQTVGRYAEAMAQRLDLGSEEVERVRLAGMLHDIGKISIPDSILAKAGPLDSDEMQEMRRHPVIGARIARNARLDDIAAWIEAHHERPDGRGYPSGIAGEQIPLEARILAVADSYEAMTNDRAYRPAMPQAAAEQELRRGAGTQFDERVVAVFLALVGREERPEATVAYASESASVTK